MAVKLSAVCHCSITNMIFVRKTSNLADGWRKWLASLRLMAKIDRVDSKEAIGRKYDDKYIYFQDRSFFQELQYFTSPSLHSDHLLEQIDSPE